MNFETDVKKYLVDLTVNSQKQEPMVIYGYYIPEVSDGFDYTFDFNFE